MRSFGAQHPAPGQTPTGTDGAQLSALHREILRFDANRSAHHPSKEAAILERFGISSSAYYALRAWIVEQPEAMRIAPAVVRSVTHGIERRRAARENPSRLAG